MVEHVSELEKSIKSDDPNNLISYIE